MNRLTFKNESGAWDVPIRTSDDVAAFIPSQEIIERLAAYENTGLEPEEAEACKVALMGKTLAEIKEIEGLSIERMKELAKAKAEGRLLILPCAVRDVVYFLRHHFDGSAEIVQGKVSMLQQKSNLSWKFRVSEGGFVFDRKLDDLGKTVFLTREEAEATLKGGDANARKSRISVDDNRPYGGEDGR